MATIDLTKDDVRTATIKDLVDLNYLAEPFSKLPKLINPLPESTKPPKLTRDEVIKSILKDNQNTV